MAHMKCIVLLTLVLALALTPSLTGATASPNNIFILAGQSNMAGRGGVTRNATTHVGHWDGIVPTESQPNPSTFRFSAGSVWEQAREPLHFDIDYNKTNGIGPGMSFANALLANAKANIGNIGLVPCAIGGTHIREWMKGTDNYTRLVDRIKASEAEGGKVQAFFWYQGESDASVEAEAHIYAANLVKFLTDIRTDLNRPLLPIILVQIATQDTTVSPIINFLSDVRGAQETIGWTLPKVKVVDARKMIGRHVPGLNSDNCHLNVRSQVGLGKMLANAFVSTFGHELGLKF